MGLSERLHAQKKLRGGYSIGDYTPPRKGPYGLEMHMPLANYEGPRTDVRRRLKEGLKPTTRTDAGAKLHDIQYHNIGVKLAKGQITRAQAAQQIKASDNTLLKTASRNKMSINPVEHLHANAAIAGILGKKGLQATGLMDEMSFIGSEPDELEGGRKKKKKDPLCGLKKRFKKMKA